MDWVCPHDHDRLAGDNGTVCCVGCGRQYARRDDMPVFGGDGDGASSAPLLDELWELMQTGDGETAARRLCDRLGCEREQISPDWKCFVPIPAGGALLEIGAGFGDDTLVMSERAGRVFSLVPGLRNGLVLQRRLEEARRSNVRVAVASSLAALPLADASIDTIVVEDLNASGFGLSRRTMGDAVAEWHRVLAPAGSVFLGLSNPWDRRLGLGLLRRRLQARRRTEPFNRRIRRAAAGAAAGLTLGRAVREMRHRGFPAPRIYAPLPDRDRIELVIPVTDTRVVRYFLNNMLRKNAPAVRAAIALANGTARVGLFKHLVPSYYLVFRPDAS